MRLFNISTGTLPGSARETGRWIAEHGPETIDYFSTPANVVAWSTTLAGLAIMALCLTKAALGAGREAWGALYGSPGAISLGTRREKLIHRLTEPPVALKHEDARRGGVQIVGPPGQGKSTLLVKAIVQALVFGYTVVVLEIDGDLTRRLLPHARAMGIADRVFCFDPSVSWSSKWNPLAGDPHRVVQQAVDTVASVSAGHEFYSDLREDVLRHMTALACAYAGHAGYEADLRLLLWMLTDLDGTDRILEVRRDDSGNTTVGASFVKGDLRAWLEQEFLAWGRRERREYLVGLRNILRRLLSDEQVVDALCPGEGEPAFDLRGALESGGLVVFRASSEAVGGVAARTVLTWALQRLQQETLGRKVPMRPVLAVVDEAHDLLGHRNTVAAESYAGWYAQCRKFNVVPWLGYQSFYQLPDVLRRVLDASARQRSSSGACTATTFATPKPSSATPRGSARRSGRPPVGPFSHLGLTHFRGPIRVKRSSSVKGVEEDGQDRKALLA